MLLNLQGGGNIAGLVDADHLITMQPLTLAPKGALLSRHSTTFNADVMIAPEAKATVHYLSSAGTFENQGDLTIIGMRPGSHLSLINSGKAQIDAEQELPRNSQDTPQNLALLLSSFDPEEIALAEAKLQLTASPAIKQEVQNRIQMIPTSPTFVSGSDIANLNGLIVWCLETIAELPAQNREELLIELRERINLIAPVYASSSPPFNAHFPTMFNGIRTSFLPKLQSAIDWAKQQTIEQQQQLEYLSRYKALVTEIFAHHLQTKAILKADSIPAIRLSAVKPVQETANNISWPREFSSKNVLTLKREILNFKNLCESSHAERFPEFISRLPTNDLKRFNYQYQLASKRLLIIPASLSTPQSEDHPDRKFAKALQEKLQSLESMAAALREKDCPERVQQEAINQAKKRTTYYKSLLQPTIGEMDAEFASLSVEEIHQKGHAYKQQFLDLARGTSLEQLEVDYQALRKKLYAAAGVDSDGDTASQKFGSITPIEFLPFETWSSSQLLNHLKKNAVDYGLPLPAKIEGRSSPYLVNLARHQQKAITILNNRNIYPVVSDEKFREKDKAAKKLYIFDLYKRADMLTSSIKDSIWKMQGDTQLLLASWKARNAYRKKYLFDHPELVQQAWRETSVDSIQQALVDAELDKILGIDILSGKNAAQWRAVAIRYAQKAGTHSLAEMSQVLVGKNDAQLRAAAIHAARAYREKALQDNPYLLQQARDNALIIADELLMRQEIEKLIPIGIQSQLKNQYLAEHPEIFEQARQATRAAVHYLKRLEQQIMAYKNLAAEIFTVHLHAANRSTGQLTLKSGRFDFTSEDAFVNEGTLVQEQAAIRWLAKASEAFNTGVWAVKGSLELDTYRSENLGVLEVDGTLRVTTSDDAMAAFKGLAKVKTQRLVMHAPSLKDVTPEDKILPWVLELHLEQDFETKAKMTTGSLELFCKGFKPRGKLFTHQLDIKSQLADLDVTSIVFGGHHVRLDTQTLAINGRVTIPGKACPDILYKRSGSGFHSEGPIVLDVKEYWHNYYGTIYGSCYQLTGPSLVNTAGYIHGTDEAQKSFLRMARIEHTRDVQGSYQDWGQCTGHASMAISAARRYNHDQLMWCSNGKCRERPLSPTCETSEEAVIYHKGDLDLVYDSLDVMVSQITSANTLVFIAEGQKKEVGDTFSGHVGTRSQERNGKKPLIRSRHLQGDLGDAMLAGTLRAEDVAITAANLTLQNMQLPSKQKGMVVRLVEELLRPGHSKLYELTDAGYDTVIPWTQKSFPRSLAVVGSDVKHLPITFSPQLTMRAFEHLMGPLFLDAERGINYLGSSLDLLMERAVEFVRAQKGTTTATHLIQDGGITREIEVVKNADITMEDLIRSGIPMVLMEFAKNFNREEDNLRARKYAEDLRKAAIEACAIFPAEKDTRSGIFAEKGQARINVTEGDFTSRGSVISGHGGSLNVPKGKAAFLAQPVTGGDQDNSYQVLNRAGIENLGVKSEGEEHIFDVKTRDGIEAEGAAHNAADKESIIKMQTAGQYSNRVAYIHNHQTSYFGVEKGYGKREVHEQIANPSRYDGNGTMDIESAVGIEEQSTEINTATKEKAPTFAFTGAHNTRSEQTQITTRGSRNIFGGSSSKTRMEDARSWFFVSARINAPFHVTTTEAYVQGVIHNHPGIVYDIVHDITFASGVNQSQYQMQSSYKGMVWNKARQEAASHVIHVPNTFNQPVTVHSKRTVVEDTVARPSSNLISDTTPVMRLVQDQHHSTSKSHKSLSAGAAMITKLAVALVIGNPFAGGGLGSTMAGAGFDTLCSEAAINMIEHDGKPGRALQAMRQKNIVKTVARSVTAAGLNGALGVGTAPTSVESFAKEFLARSAVQTTMAIAFDGVKPGEAIRQGALNAAVQTVGACIANKIGDMASSKMGPAQIGDITQDIFHGFLGAGMGAATAAITGQDIGKGATSGAIGAVVGHRTAKTFDSKALGDLVAVTVAMMTDQDVGIAYLASNNATTYNYSRHRLNPIDKLINTVEKDMQPQEGEQATPEQEAYLEGRDAFVDEVIDKAFKQNPCLDGAEIENLVNTAHRMYAVKYMADRSAAMTGQAIVMGSEIIPGMRGVNQAWMGFVNHVRGTMPEGTTLTDEILWGIHSGLFDGALTIATMGASEAYFMTRAAVSAARVAGAVEARGIGLSAKSKIYLDRKLFQEHHIISNKHPATQNNDLLKLAGFDLNSSANTMFLPTRSGARISTTSRSIHEGRHLDSVSKGLAEEMNFVVTRGQPLGWTQPQYHNELMQILSRERTALKSGDRILNTHYRPWATNGGNLK